MEQLRWTWGGCKTCVVSLRKGIVSAPYVKLFMVAALGDSLGDVFGYICTPYVAGPVHSLLAQFTMMFTAMLSICILGRKYSLAQIIGLAGVEAAVLVGIYPSLGGTQENS